MEMVNRLAEAHTDILLKIFKKMKLHLSKKLKHLI